MKKFKIILLCFAILSLFMWIHAKFFDTWDNSKVNKDFRLNTNGQTQVIHISYLGGCGIIYWNDFQEEQKFMFDGSKVYLGSINSESANSFVANKHEEKIIYYLIERSNSWGKYSALRRLRGYPIDYIRYYLFLPPTIFLIILSSLLTIYIRKRRKQLDRTNGST